MDEGMTELTFAERGTQLGGEADGTIAGLTAACASKDTLIGEQQATIDDQGAALLSDALMLEDRNESITLLSGSISTLQAQVVKKQGVIDSLRLKLNPPPPMAVGSSIWREGTETLQQAFDRRTINWGVAPEAIRLFDPDGKLDAWPTLPAATYVSFKGNPADVMAGVYDPQYRWLFGQTPRNPVNLAWSYWHEPLPDWTPAAWRQAFQHIANIADEYPTGRAMSRGPILQGWDANPKSGRNIADLVPPVRIDFVGFDAYPFHDSVLPGDTTACYRLCADAAATHFGVPWVLTETGLKDPDRYTPEQTAAWITQSVAVARDLGCFTYIYFDSPVGGEFRLSSPVEWAAIGVEVRAV